MHLDELPGILAFLKNAEQLKDTLRSGYTASGRPESTAEHTWRLCLMVMLFEKEYPQLDTSKLMKMCIIHDLGEAINGDIAAIHQVAGEDKGKQEREDLLTLMEPLPDAMQRDILELWDDYENVASEEARVAKAFDKLETVLQHTQGKNPDNFDYEFNLHYGQKYTDYDQLTSTLRQIIDKDTSALASRSRLNKQTHE